MSQEKFQPGPVCYFYLRDPFNFCRGGWRNRHEYHLPNIGEEFEINTTQPSSGSPPSSSSGCCVILYYLHLKRSFKIESIFGWKSLSFLGVLIDT